MAQTMRGVLVATALPLVGYASAADLKPGVPTGALKDGFEQTSEGLALTGRGRTLDDVWAATLRGVKAVTRSTGHPKIVDQEPREFRAIEGMNFLDSEVCVLHLDLPRAGRQRDPGAGDEGL